MPPNRVSFRLKTNQAANAKAWVMMAKYTPLMRLRNARNPKRVAKSTGTRMAPRKPPKKLLNGYQKSGSSFTWVQTMKSGSSLP